MAASFEIDTYTDLKELGIDCDDNYVLDVTFNRAADHLPSLIPTLDNQTLLNLYGYYKQGQEGPCNIPKPSWYDIKAKSKWEAWNKLGNMPQDEAKTIYVETIKKLDPNFASSKLSWVSVSTFLPSGETIDVNTTDRNIVDYVKEENLWKVTEMIKSNPIEQLNFLDDDGLGLIHWATDRGSIGILKVLVEFGANVNLRDVDGQTALHYASSCGHLDCAKFLLKHGARKDILDHDGLMAQSVANDDVIKELLAASL